MAKQIIGFDYWQTVTQHPQLFAFLAECIIARGGEVHIITAVGKNRAKTMKMVVDTMGIPYTSLEICVFTHFKQAPQLKLEACKRLGVQLFVDDRLDTCEILNENGIISLNILKGKS